MGVFRVSCETSILGCLFAGHCTTYSICHFIIRGVPIWLQIAGTVIFTCPLCVMEPLILTALYEKVLYRDEKRWKECWVFSVISGWVLGEIQILRCKGSNTQPAQHNLGTCHTPVCGTVDLGIQQCSQWMGSMIDIPVVGACVKCML